MGKLIKLADDKIVNKIHLLRGKRVMLNSDLAEMYGVEVKNLKRQVRRNLSRFPEDFMFRLTKNEWGFIRSQIVTASESSSIRSQNATASQKKRNTNST